MSGEKNMVGCLMVPQSHQEMKVDRELQQCPYLIYIEANDHLDSFQFDVILSDTGFGEYGSCANHQE